MVVLLEQCSSQFLLPSLQSCSKSSISRILCPIDEFEEACCTTFLGGKDLPAPTASSCSFSWTAWLWHLLASWYFRADASKFVLPRLKLGLKFWVEQILSFCEEQIAQTIFPSFKSCSKGYSVFHLSTLFSEGYSDEDMFYFTDVNCTFLFRKLLSIRYTYNQNLILWLSIADVLSSLNMFYNAQSSIIWLNMTSCMINESNVHQ